MGVYLSRCHLMAKKRNRIREHFARTFLGYRSLHKEYAKQIPTALTHRSISDSS